jgi:hypothetical protein
VERKQAYPHNASTSFGFAVSTWIELSPVEQDKGIGSQIFAKILSVSPRVAANPPTSHVKNKNLFVSLLLLCSRQPFRPEQE